MHTKVAGRYKITAVSAVTGKERLLADWFPNIITDIGLDRMGTTDYNWFEYAYVGSGSSEALASNVSLGSRIATSTLLSSSGASTNAGSPTYHSYKARTYTFGVGVAAGNLSEVGVGWATTDINSIFSRALILDSYGNPTTITVLSDEYLYVTYEIQYYPLLTDTTGSITFTGNIGGTYDYIIRRADILNDVNPLSSGSIQINTPMSSTGYSIYENKSYYGNIGTITSYPSSAIHTSGAFTWSHNSYVKGSFELYSTINIPVNTCNHANGLRCISFALGQKYHQIQFDPAIPKTSDDIITLRLKQSWGRL